LRKASVVCAERKRWCLKCVRWRLAKGLVGRAGRKWCCELYFEEWCRVIRVQ